jgi:hypothetical protein
VHEYVFAILAGDEAIALGVVKPLYCSLFQCVPVFCFEFLLRTILQVRGGIA